MTNIKNTVALTRRKLAGMALTGLVAGTARAQSSATDLAPEHMRHMHPAFDGPPIKVAMLVYPEMVMLDLVGPQTILKILGAEIHLVGKTRDPVSTDIGVSLAPTDDFTSCPHGLDVLFVPGGLMGTIACMGDPDVLKFLNDRAASARFVTSVCTGSLILAAAGLLRGYRATSNWGVVDLLPIMGAIESHDRVTQDRNRVTGAGVTAGLDFGLMLAAQLRSQAAAEHVQLIIEYAPKPPFHHGSPDEIPAVQMKRERSRRTWMDSQARQAANEAAKRLGL